MSAILSLQFFYPMFIPSNVYQLKRTEGGIFEKKHTHEFPISALAIQSDKLFFASGEEIYGKSSQGFKKIHTMYAEVTCLNGQNSLICIGDSSGSVAIIGDQKNLLRRYYEQTARITDIRVSSEKNLIAVSSDDGSVKVFSLTEEKSVSELYFEEECVKSIDISDEHLVVALSNRVEVYDLSSLQKVAEYKIGTEVSRVRWLEGEVKKVLAASRNRLYIFNTESSECIEKIVHSGDILDVGIWGSVVYTLGGDNHFKGFSIRDLTLLNDFKFDEKAVAFSVDEGVLRVALSNNTVIGLPEDRQKREKQYARRKLKALEEEVSYREFNSVKKRLTERELLLRSFQYKAAVSSAFDTDDLVEVYKVLKFIYDNRGLMKTLADAPMDFLASYMQFCLQAIHITEFGPIVLESLVIIFALYSFIIKNDERLRDTLEQISEAIDMEIFFQENLIKTISFQESFM